MTKTFFMFVTGLITTMFGVGGVEHSITDAQLLSAVLVSAVGLGIMYCSTLMMQQEQ